MMDERVITIKYDYPAQIWNHASKCRYSFKETHSLTPFPSCVSGIKIICKKRSFGNTAFKG